MKFLRDVLNLVLVNFMVLSILRLFLIIHAGLSLSFHTKTVLAESSVQGWLLGLRFFLRRKN